MHKRVLAFLFAAATIACGDSLVLRNGSTVLGTFLGGDNRSIRFATGNQVNTYNLTDIASITFSAPPPATSAPAPTNAPPPDAAPPTDTANAADQSSNPAPADQSAQAAPAPAATAGASGPMGIEVPAGTPVTIRLIDPVNSERDTLGQTYRASIDQPIAVNGQTVIPRGADAMVALVQSQQSGKIEGRTVMTLQLRNVTVNGRSYDVVSSDVTQASSSRGARSAKVIGGTAALGAILGGIAGGGAGAAIGAGSGAAVGTAAQVMTSGQKVKVPAETRLTFNLTNPLDL